MNVKDILDKIKGFVESKQDTSGFAYVFWVPNYESTEGKRGQFKAAPAEELLGPKASFPLQVTALSEGTFIFGPFPANNKQEAIRAFSAWLKECETRGVSVFKENKHVARTVVFQQLMDTVLKGGDKVKLLKEQSSEEILDARIKDDIVEAIHRYDTKSGEPCANCGEIHNDGDDGPNVEIRVIALPMGASGGGLSMLPSIQDNETKDFGPN